MLIESVEKKENSAPLKFIDRNILHAKTPVFLTFLQLFKWILNNNLILRVVGNNKICTKSAACSCQLASPCTKANGDAFTVSVQDAL
jgi:hypothetical protein